MDKSQTISVVICAYTELRWNALLEAVASVQRQSQPAAEIVVVVDHNPALLERVRANLTGVITVPNHETRGLSGARNSGIAAARGEIIAFMDEDAAAAPDWLEKLCAGYENPQAMGVGGAIEPWWLNGRPPWFPAEFNWVVGCTYLGMPETAAPVRNLIGCNMSLRRGVLTAVGGFRSGIGRIGTKPVGCEETELCIRAGQRWPQGYFLYEPGARARHQVPASRANWRYFLARCYAEGQSKAQVTGQVGAADGLAAERDYVLRALPLGVLRGLADPFLWRDPAGLARAGAIVLGVAVTTAGYLAGKLTEMKDSISCKRRTILNRFAS